MKHISEIIRAILPFKIDNVREMTREDRDRLRQEVNDWLKAENLDPAVKQATEDALKRRG